MRKLGIFLILFLFVFCLAPGLVFASSLRIHFIDVGEGDSILVETPRGKAILIDAGNLISGYRVVEYLKKNKVGNLDYLIFTHPHPDHIGGAFYILQMMRVSRIYDNGQDLRDMAKAFDIYRWYIDLVRTRDNYDVLKAEEKFLVDGAVFKVLWPPRQPSDISDWNVNSLVVMVEYKEFRALLTGDLIISGERELLKRREALKASLLKVGHHGWQSSSEEFLKAVSPEVSIISVNKDNLRGYPSEETLKRLKDSGSKIYRTDKHGDIIIDVTEAGTFTVETSR